MSSKGEPTRDGDTGQGAPRPAGKARKLTPSTDLSPHKPTIPRVLIASPSRVLRDRLRAQLAAAGFDTFVTGRPNEAVSSCRTHAFDAAIAPIDWTHEGGALPMKLTEADGALAVIAIADEPDFEGAIDALRTGAADLVGKRTPGDELVERVKAACERTKSARSREARLNQLQGLCKQLNSARKEVTEHVGSMCDDLVTAYQDLSDQIGRVGLAGEFTGLVRQELDIEELLRTVLEFVLAKVGPLNAGIYLPAESGDFSLGAYVNYDCEKDNAELLFDHLADTLAPRCESGEGSDELRIYETDSEIADALGEDAGWLDGRCMAVFTCRQRGECLAVACLFRDAEAGFSSEQIAVIETIADLFSQQLGRVISVHHRHLPIEPEFGDQLSDPLDGPFDGPTGGPADGGLTDPFGGMFDEPDDDIDLAA